MCVAFVGFPCRHYRVTLDVIKSYEMSVRVTPQGRWLSLRPVI
jgi:hypothetical protein